MGLPRDLWYSQICTYLSVPDICTLRITSQTHLIVFSDDRAFAYHKNRILSVLCHFGPVWASKFEYDTTEKRSSAVQLARSLYAFKWMLKGLDDEDAEILPVAFRFAVPGGYKNVISVRVAFLLPGEYQTDPVQISSMKVVECTAELASGCKIQFKCGQRPRLLHGWFTNFYVDPKEDGRSFFRRFVLGIEEDESRFTTDFKSLATTGYVSMPTSMGYYGPSWV